MGQHADEQDHEHRAELGPVGVELRGRAPVERHAVVVGLRRDQHDREEYLDRHDHDRRVADELAESRSVERDRGIENLPNTARP